MHGRIDVQSSIDRGSRFRVELPLMRLPLPLDAAAPQAVTLRHIGVDDAGALECLLALGRAGMVADVLGPWLPSPADAVLVAGGALLAQPGGLAATLAKVATGRSLIGLIGATEADADAALASGLHVERLPDSPERRFETLAARLSQALAERSTAPLAPPRRGLDGLRVLLVEDKLVNQVIARELLHSRGCIVSLASAGEQAVDLLIVGHAGFDIVLMDVQMPGIDGNEATRRLRRAGIALPIVALSAHAFDEDRMSSLAAGMDGYVTKPLDIDVLTEAMLRACTPPHASPALH